ncbi:unnamed protein product [Symbiodinium sp. CCMP2456]|nr:unnamed protein product [Symbiodinium sp. CCMP2456]
MLEQLPGVTDKAMEELGDAEQPPVTSVQLSPGDPDFEDFSCDGDQAAFLTHCHALTAGREIPKHQVLQDAASILDLEIDSGDRSIYSYPELHQKFPNVRQLLYKTVDCRRVIYDLRGFGMCRTLKSLKLQLSFQTMCEDEPSKCGVTALEPLAGTLEVLEIGRLRFNVASDLEVLKRFHKLRVLKYHGVNEGGREPSVLDLRGLSSLQDLEFTEASFTAETAAADAEDDSEDDNPIMRMLHPKTFMQALVLPDHLPCVTFRHQYGSRITPELRQLLRTHGCECKEYVPKEMVGSGTLNMVDGYQPADSEQIEAEERAEKAKSQAAKKELRLAQQRRRAEAFEKLPGLTPSTDGNFELGDVVFAYDGQDVSFTKLSVKEKPVRSTSLLHLYHENTSRFVHPSCVYRKVPELGLCSSKDANGCEVWKQKRSKPLRARRAVKLKRPRHYPPL